VDEGLELAEVIKINSKRSPFDPEGAVLEI
jgi:hypothetical protein